MSRANVHWRCARLGALVVRRRVDVCDLGLSAEELVFELGGLDLGLFAGSRSSCVAMLSSGFSFIMAAPASSARSDAKYSLSFSKKPLVVGRDCLSSVSANLVNKSR